MEIRQATKQDMETLLQLRYAFLEEFRHISRAARAKLEPELRRYFDKYLEVDDFVALVGWEGEAAVCSAFLTVRESPPNDQYPNGRIGYVFNVYTVPERRGKGCAKQLMQALVEKARELDVTAINLNASAAGRPLYETLGFSVLTDTAMRLQLHEDAAD